MIGVAIAIAAAILGVTAALVALALRGFAAEKAAGNERARADTNAVLMNVAIANAKTESARADAEKERGDALDAAIVRSAVAAVGPVRGSFDRLLQEAEVVRARAAGRHGDAKVPDGGVAREPTAELGPDDLLRPGE